MTYFCGLRFPWQSNFQSLCHAFLVCLIYFMWVGLLLVPTGPTGGGRRNFLSPDYLVPLVREGSLQAVGQRVLPGLDICGGWTALSLWLDSPSTMPPTAQCICLCLCLSLGRHRGFPSWVLVVVRSSLMMPPGCMVSRCRKGVLDLMGEKSASPKHLLSAKLLIPCTGLSLYCLLEFLFRPGMKEPT